MPGCLPPTCRLSWGLHACRHSRQHSSGESPPGLGCSPTLPGEWPTEPAGGPGIGLCLGHFL